MKINSLTAIFASAISFASGIAYGIDYYVPSSGGKYSELTWWSDASGSGTLTGAPTEDDNIVITDSSSATVFTVDKDITVRNIFVKNTGNNARYYNCTEEYTIHVLEDVKLSRGFLARGNLVVDGNISYDLSFASNAYGAAYGFGDSYAAMNYLKVGGNIVPTSGNAFTLNVVRKLSETQTAGFGADELVDAEIGGLIEGTRTDSMLRLGNGGVNQKNHRDVYYKVGGVKDTIIDTIKSPKTYPEGNVVNLMFTNNKIASTLNEETGKWVVSSNMNIVQTYGGVIKLYMNADKDAVQNFTGESLGFTGGVKMQSGSLFVNYAETSGVNHGDLVLAKLNNTVSAVFGNSSQETLSEGNAKFTFTNLVIGENGGSIQIRLGRNGETLTYDALNFSGSAKLDAGIAEGKVTILFADDSSESLEANLALLISDTLLVDESTKSAWTKLISWTGVENGVKFVAEDLKVGEDTYNFQTFNASDGLYGAYVMVTVPEPSTYAGIFGALALGLAIYRRRK